MPEEVFLVSRYNLNGGSAADAVGGVNGTVVGTWTSTAANSLVAGDAGTSFYKEGGAAHIILPASSPAHTLNEVSLAFYYQPSGNSNKHIMIAARANPGAPGDFSIERLTNGRLRAWHVGADNALRFFESTDGIATTNLVTGTAYRITLTLGPTGAHLYLDDTLVSSITANINGWNNATPKYVGIWVDGVQSAMQGVIDRIEVWSGQLTAGGVAAFAAAQSIIPPEETPGVGYTPFPFVTNLNPAVNHTGVTNRPGYNAATPLNAQFTDPMSGIPIVRVTGNRGATVFITGNQNSGLVWPRSLRNDNSATAGRVWNADGTLLFLDQSRNSGTDGANPARSCLIDTSGTRGGSQRFQILRAAGGPALGNNFNVWWFWDPLNPLRAYVMRPNHSMDEWWPIGGDGHAVDEINNIHGPIAGFDQGQTGRAHLVHCSWDGQFFVHPVRRTSDGLRGGIRRNLLTGATGPFIPWPDPSNNNGDTDRSAQGTSALGRYTKFTFGGRQYVVDVTNNQLMFDTNSVNLPTANWSHSDWGLVNGRECLVAPVGGNGVYLIDILDGVARQVSTMQTGNPNHYSGRNTADLAETYGAVGGMTTGQRYGIIVKSAAPRGIRGIRLGPNDLHATRFICDHRGIREAGGGLATNESEIHCQVSPDGRLVSFNSNWRAPGVVTDFQQDCYVAMLPDAWWSPNNDGS